MIVAVDWDQPRADLGELNKAIYIARDTIAQYIFDMSTLQKRVARFNRARLKYRNDDPRRIVA
jgi:hypothetical protein